MSNEPRIPVNLTSDQIDGLIVAVSKIRIGDVHMCRIKDTHTALQELRDVQADIRISNE